jgi:dihydrofolate synthase/folylpolyglutamate synthase
VKASVPRSLDNNLLLKEAQKHKLKGQSFESVEEGLKTAIKSSKKNELVLVSGSTFVVADALELKHL